MKAFKAHIILISGFTYTGDRQTEAATADSQAAINPAPSTLGKARVRGLAGLHWNSSSSSEAGEDRDNGKSALHLENQKDV